MTIPSITALPTPAPSRALSEAAFVAASDNLFGALPGFVAQANASIAGINQAVNDINGEVVGVWTQIGADVATTSGATVTFANIPANYRDLRIEFAGVSANATFNLVVGFSANGSSYTSAHTIVSGAAASATLFGSLFIADYRASNFSAVATVGNIASAPGVVAAGADCAVRLSGPLTHVQILVTGATFDAGLVRFKVR